MMDLIDRLDDAISRMPAELFEYNPLAQIKPLLVEARNTIARLNAIPSAGMDGRGVGKSIITRPPADGVGAGWPAARTSARPRASSSGER